MPTKKTIPLCTQPHSLLTPYASNQKKMLTVDVYASKDMLAYYPWQKPNDIRTASSSGVCIAMPNISQALFYSLHIFINIIIVQNIDF